MKTGTYFEQTGTATSYNAYGHALHSEAIGVNHPFAVDVSKASSAIVEITQDGQIVETKIIGQ